MSFIGKAGVFISGGIFKMMDTIDDDQSFPMSYAAYWRNQSFPAWRLDEPFVESYKTRFNTFLMSESSQVLRWGADDYQFPPVRLTNLESTVTLTGVKSNLTCTPVEIVSTETADGRQVSSLQDHRCNSPISVVAVNSSTHDLISSMIWRYLGPDVCPEVDGGLWWILYTQQGTSGDSNSSLIQNPSSLLCAPSFFEGSVDLTADDVTSWYSLDIFGKDNIAVSLATNKVQSEKLLDPGRWKADGQVPLPDVNLPAGVDFPTFVSTFINGTLTGSLWEVSRSSFFDSMSMVTLRTAGQNVSLWNISSHDLGLFASNTFSLAVSTLLSQDFDLNNTLPFGTTGLYFNSTYGSLEAVDITLRPTSGTVLLEPVTQTAPITVEGRPVLYQAVVQPAALYAATGVLLMYLVAMPVLILIANRSAWRTPRDVSYPANVMCMLYDSSLPDLVHVKESMNGGQVLDMSEVAKRRWGIGLFHSSESGERRLGIEELGSVERVPSVYELRRRRLWSRLKTRKEDEESSK